MRVISRKRLRDFWEGHGHEQARQPLLAWLAEVKKARWRSPSDVKSLYRSADFVGKDRIVFNIGGNKYWLVVAVKYTAQIVFIKFVGTHREYDEIDVKTVH
jgi:mRNA interferase HigB